MTDDAIGALMRSEGLDFVTAIKTLALDRRVAQAIQSPHFDAAARDVEWAALGDAAKARLTEQARAAQAVIAEHAEQERRDAEAEAYGLVDEAPAAHIAKAAALLPAWFIPRMMGEPGPFGLLLTTGDVLCIRTIADVHKDPSRALWLDLELIPDRTASVTAEAFSLPAPWKKLRGAPTPGYAFASAQAAHVIAAVELAPTTRDWEEDRNDRYIKFADAERFAKAPSNSNPEYYPGTARHKSHPLVGAGLHYKDADGAVQNQAEIVAVIPSNNPAVGDLALIQYFEWWVGDATTRRLMPLAELAGSDRWVFYRSTEEMNDHYHRVDDAVTLPSLGKKGHRG